MMNRFTDFGAVCALLVMVAAVGTSSRALGQVVIGDWESAGPEGWIDWNSGTLQTMMAPRYEFNSTGATLGFGALEYNHPAQGFAQWAAIKLQLGTPGGDGLDGNGVDEWRDDFLAHTKVAVDVTLVASEMTADPGNNFATIGLVVNAHDYGFTNQGDPESVTPFVGYNGANNFNPQLLVDTQTTTWVWDIADTHDGVDTDINPSPFYIELVFDTFSNGGVVYHIDNVRLFTPGGLLGDFDQNNVVDGADLTLWKAGFGATGQTDDSNGDADADGDVDGEDFLIWQQELGMTGSVAALSAVPEPACGTLGVVALVAAYAARRKLNSSCPFPAV